LLLSRSWLAETLDADRGVGKARGDLQRVAKGLDIASQIADIDVGTLLQLGNSQCGSRVPVGQKGCHALRPTRMRRPWSVTPSTQTKVGLAVKATSVAKYAMTLPMPIRRRRPLDKTLVDVEIREVGIKEQDCQCAMNFR
jgi:hypothetical protein